MSLASPMKYPCTQIHTPYAEVEELIVEEPIYEMPVEKDRQMERDYSDCYYCGGLVKEKHIVRELRRQGRLFIFENVPAGVCTQCGEKFLKPDVAKTIDLFLTEKMQPSRFEEVPVYEYKADVA